MHDSGEAEIGARNHLLGGNMSYTHVIDSWIAELAQQPRVRAADRPLRVMPAQPAGGSLPTHPSMELEDER
jgi:hypothetical protein